MADTKITALAAIATVDPAADVLPIVDISDTSMAASGTTKKVTTNQILGAGGTATLASAAITGDLTVDTSTLKVDSANNRVIVGHTSGSAAFQVTNAGAAGLEIQPTGFSSAPLIQSYNRSGSAYTQLTLDGSTIVHALSGTTAMTLNSTGLGIGVVPSTHDAGKGLEVGALGNGLWCNNSTFNQLLQNATYNGGWKYAAAASTAASRLEMGGSFGFYIAPAGTAPNAITFGDAKMTLDASGNLLVGKTALSSATAGIQLEAVGAVTSTRSAGAAAYFNRLTSDGFLVLIGRESSIVGDISVTTTGTTFNSTSDYRLKEAVQPLVGGLARVSALKPSVYKWKANGSAGEGFLAHELAEVVPAAVTGEKDAVNADGSIKAQSIDMSRVVPILVAAIQELTARLQTLEAR